MIINSCKEYKKLEPSIRKAVDKCISKLENRYKYYQEQNIAISNVFGDGNIIHDIVDDGFYVYKSQFNKIQVRLLYKVDSNNKINVIYFYVKNGNNLVNIKSNKSNPHRQTKYLQLFKNYVELYKRKENEFTCYKSKNQKPSLISS